MFSFDIEVFGVQLLNYCSYHIINTNDFTNQLKICCNLNCIYYKANVCVCRRTIYALLLFLAFLSIKEKLENKAKKKE